MCSADNKPFLFQLQSEVSDVMKRSKRAVKRKQYKSAWDEERASKVKKQKVISTGNNKRPSIKSNRLYCICKSPFDPTRSVFSKQAIAMVLDKKHLVSTVMNTCLPLLGLLLFLLFCSCKIQIGH